MRYEKEETSTEGRISTEESSSTPKKTKEKFIEPKPNSVSVSILMRCVSDVHSSVMQTFPFTTQTHSTASIWECTHSLVWFGFGSLKFRLILFGFELDFLMFLVCICPSRPHLCDLTFHILFIQAN